MQLDNTHRAPFKTMARREDNERQQHDTIIHSLNFKQFLNIKIRSVYFTLFYFVVLLVVLL